MIFADLVDTKYMLKLIVNDDTPDEVLTTDGSVWSGPWLPA